MWSLRIVMLPQVMMIVMMTRPPRRRLLQALSYKRSLLSLKLHRHASWLKPLRYKLVMMEVMRNMIMKMKMKVIVLIMNQLRMNYLTC